MGRDMASLSYLQARLVLTLMVCFLLAGCLGASETDGGPAPTAVPVNAPDDLQEEGNDAPEDADDEEEASSGDRDRRDEDPRILYWSSEQEIGDIAARIVLDLPEDGECIIETSVAGERTGPGPKMATLLASPGEDPFGWTVYSTSSIAHAHVGDIVDTREALDSSGQWVSGSTARLPGGLDEVEVTILAEDVSPWWNWITQNDAIAVEASCEGPIAPLDAAQSSTVTLFNEESMDGGVGASTVDGSASVATQDQIETTQNHTEVFVGAFGMQGGSVTVDHPDGEAEWMLLPSVLGENHALQGSPGAYTITLDRAGGYFDAFWGTVFGLEPVETASFLGEDALEDQG